MLKIALYYDEEEKSTKFYLLEDVVDSSGGTKIIVPIGFCSDGGSIPRAFWNICNPLDARWLKAFLVHDYLYTVKICTRAEADAKLREDLKTAGMSLIRRNEIYYAVRSFGGTHWS